MKLEKVYDELYGMIEDLKKKITAADVDITPALESGTKIADYSCDGVSGSLYAPTQVNADWNAAEGAAQILNKPTIPDVRIYPAVNFVFDNSTTAIVNVSDISADLADAACIIGFAGTAGTAVQIVRSGNKLSISAIVGSPISVTLPINLVAFYAPPTRTKTTKKK